MIHFPRIRKPVPVEVVWLCFRQGSAKLAGTFFTKSLQTEPVLADTPLSASAPLAEVPARTAATASRPGQEPFAAAIPRPPPNALLFEGRAARAPASPSEPPPAESTESLSPMAHR